jgi:hypothetical protein
MSNSNQLFNRIDAILDGIDRQEDDPKGGWWRTEDGARVGRIKLWELKEAIQEHLITVAGTACAGAARTQPFPVDLAALHDPDFSNGLSSIEHLNRLSGVAPSSPALLPTEENMSDLVDEMLGTVLPEGAGARLITRALELWGAAPLAPFIEWTQFALARYGRLALQPQQEGVKPTDADLDALERKHWKLDSVVEYEPGQGCREVFERQETFDHRAFAHTVLARYGRPTFQPIPVSERLPGPDDCCSNPRNGQGQWCWGWVWPGGMDRDDPIPYSGCWRMMRRQWLSDEALAWAPWWAIPLPGGHSSGAKEMAEGQPCSP